MPPKVLVTTLLIVATTLGSGPSGDISMADTKSQMVMVGQL